MLVLTRKSGEELVIGDDIRVVVSRITGNRVTIGVDAPDHIRIVRGELKSVVDSFSEPAEAAEGKSPVAAPPTALPVDMEMGPLTPRNAR
ncbi:MAG: carbon storage regulator [Pirellulaceae bacterium]|jgi:carbon storage regulator|nr:carbon storage regulator [Pirellulaceae bacterium]